MALSQRIQSAMLNWDKEEYWACSYEDFLFIRETDLFTLDEQVNDMETYMTQMGGLEFWKPNVELR